MMILGLGLFASGYFWGVNVREKEPPAASGTMNAGSLGGMEGMSGMSPGMVIVSQEKQQLLGIKASHGANHPYGWQCHL